MHALGIDASTQSCSAIVIDCASGAIVAEHSVNFGERLPQYGAPQGFIPNGTDGEVHADPLMWLDALELLLRELAEGCDLGKVAAISGAGQQHGSVYLNRHWRERLGSLTPEASLAEQLAPCLTRKTSPIWMDGSTTAACRDISAAVGGPEQVCALSGSVATERFTGPQIRRFYETSEEAYAGTERIHLVSSFLCSVLCGEDAPIDTGDAAGMNLLDIHNWDWSEALLEATAPGLRQRLPAVVPGATRAGTIADYFGAKFGFRANVPVTVFSGDNPSSLVGMGAASPGKVVISLGTSDTFFAAMPGVVCDPDGSGHVFGNPAGGPMSLQCFVNGSLAREAVKNRFDYDWEAFTEAFAKTPPGNGGNLMLPFYRPEISPPLEQARVRLKGSPEFEQWALPNATLRACVEGQMINMKRCAAWMRLSTRQIFLTGGASRNDAIAQVVADVFQARVCRLEVSGSVALGGAMRAAHEALGQDLESLAAQFCKPSEVVVEPDPTTVSAYEALERDFAACLEDPDCGESG